MADGEAYVAGSCDEFGLSRADAAGFNEATVGGVYA
jgi:hypothetical protein